MATEKIYERESRQTTHTATISNIIIEEDRKYLILDKTIFFPNEGGQPCDKGTINKIKVLSVKLVKDEIYHQIPFDSKFNISEKVFCEIDYAYRYSNMQMHTAEHMFSGFAYTVYGANNVGFHLSDNSATMDFDINFSQEQLRHLENLVNEYIYKNKTVRPFYPSEEPFEELTYRSKKDIDINKLRILEIVDVDMCACCAPHLWYTSEVGLFKIISSQSHKGGIRINYLAGERAFKYLQKANDVLENICKDLSANCDNVLDAYYQAKNNQETLKTQLAKKDEEILNLAFKNINKGYISYCHLNSCDNKAALKACLAKSEELKSNIMLISGADNYNFILVSYNIEAKDIIDNLKEKLNINAGGKNNIYQGKINNDIISIVKALEDINKTKKAS